MYCPQCGTRNPDDARFCWKCGSRIPERAGAKGGESPESSRLEPADAQTESFAATSAQVETTGAGEPARPEQQIASAVRSVVSAVGSAAPSSEQVSETLASASEFAKSAAEQIASKGKSFADIASSVAPKHREEIEENRQRTAQQARENRRKGFNIKLMIMGPIFVLLGILMITNEGTQGESKLAGLVILGYGIWLIVGIFTGGWRFVIY